MTSSLDLLVDYDSDDNSTQELHTQSRLPLPNSFNNLISKEEVTDEPDKHDGRIRSYPHERGNWNSYIYIPYECSSSYSFLCDQIIDFCRPKVEMKTIEDPHISLTRTFILLYHWIENFVSSVKKLLCTLVRFDVQFDGLKVYCNEEKTRTFLALSVGFGKMEITKSVQLLDKCLSEYKLQPFYKDASFHMSILWCLGNKKQELDTLLPDINRIFEGNLNDFEATIPVTAYACKIGHKVYNIDLL